MTFCSEQAAVEDNYGGEAGTGEGRSRNDAGGVDNREDPSQHQHPKCPPGSDDCELFPATSRITYRKLANGSGSWCKTCGLCHEISKTTHLGTADPQCLHAIVCSNR